MFLHQGDERTFKHNLGIASLLSFVAGMVNVAGFFAVKRLTTNVTGHFAYFADELFRRNFLNAFIFFLYIFFFFLGSFVSGLLVETIAKKNSKYVYVIPTVIEAILLAGVAIIGPAIGATHADTIAFLLLFAMGMQNSLVTSISNATVRTTHLTGLFTDLGIELSQLFFYRHQDDRHKLLSSIRLRLTIISFFFIGAIAGGTFYSALGLHVLLIAAGTLLAGILFDSLKIVMKRG